VAEIVKDNGRRKSRGLACEYDIANPEPVTMKSNRAGVRYEL
jgi:hypothetical protein